eukprot:bmy_12522T0
MKSVHFWHFHFSTHPQFLLIFKRKIHEDLAFLKNRQNSRSGKQQQQTFHELTYCGLDLDPLLDISQEQLRQLHGARGSGSGRGRTAACEGSRTGCRSACARSGRRHRPRRSPRWSTHLRNMIILPDTGSMVGVYNGKTFNQV